MISNLFFNVILLISINMIIKKKLIRNLKFVLWINEKILYRGETKRRRGEKGRE